MSQRNATAAAVPEPVTVDFTDKVLQFVDTASENSSCKDSGTGDSAKRSNDDLLPDEYTLIINGEWKAKYLFRICENEKRSVMINIINTSVKNM